MTAPGPSGAGDRSTSGEGVPAAPAGAAGAGDRVPVDGAQGVAAFDFDGTLIRGDSLLPFLARVAGRCRFALTMIVSAPAAGRAYRHGGRDAMKVVLLDRFLQGVPSDRLDVVGQAYGEQLAATIRPAMAERMAWHRGQGHRLVMVSASLDVYLAPLGRALGFDGVLATRLEVGHDGRMTGRLHGRNVRGPEKREQMQRWLAQELEGGAYSLWAYGDSAGDRELLAMADHPVHV